MEITTMNNYLDKVFDTPNKKAFIAFLTAGDPDADSTVKFILEMEKAGADLIEIGIPFSDPTAEGFIYVVSSMGVTGVRSEIKTNLPAIVESIRAVTDVPCAIGFGISTPEQAKAMASISDGAIVGSAIVKIIAKYGKDAAPYIGEYVKSMKDAVAE